MAYQGVVANLTVMICYSRGDWQTTIVLTGTLLSLLCTVQTTSNDYRNLAKKANLENIKVTENIKRRIETHRSCFNKIEVFTNINTTFIYLTTKDFILLQSY